MHNPLDIVEIPQGCTELGEDVPHDLFLDSMLLFRLTEYVVCQRYAIEELHDDVDVLSICKGSVVPGDIGVVQVLQDGDLFANFFNKQFVC